MTWMTAGSSSENEEGNGKWIWDGKSWWFRVDHQRPINSRLRRKVSRAVRAASDETKRCKTQVGDAPGVREPGGSWNNWGVFMLPQGPPLESIHCKVFEQHRNGVPSAQKRRENIVDCRAVLCPALLRHREGVFSDNLHDSAVVVVCACVASVGFASVPLVIAFPGFYG